MMFAAQFLVLLAVLRFTNAKCGIVDPVHSTLAFSLTRVLLINRDANTAEYDAEEPAVDKERGTKIADRRTREMIAFQASGQTIDGSGCHMRPLCQFIVVSSS